MADQPAAANASLPAECVVAEKPGRRAPEQVYLRSYWKFIFVWPIILLGYLFYFVDQWQWVSPTALFWIWAITLIVVLVAMGVDMGRNQTVFWIVLITLFWVSIRYLKDVLGWTVFTRMHHYVTSLASPYPRHGALFISIALSVVYLVMLVWIRLNQTWRFTHNEFEHVQFGRSADSLSRGTKKVKVMYPDFFEMLLCLSGTIVISNSTGTRDLRVIENVPLAPFRWRKINAMLAATAVTAATDEEEGEAEEG